MSALPRFALLPLLLTALGCGGDVDPPDPFAGPLPATCPATGREQSMVLTRLVLLKQEPTGVSPGFDLDGRVSGSDDTSSCRRRDLTSPEGTPGIDNQFSLLVPALETATAGALPALLQAAINNGQLMIAISIEGLDDRLNDPCVTLVFSRVQGSPFVGSDMRIDPGQTFDTMRSETITRVSARMRDGVVEAGPFFLPLPFAALDARFIIPLSNARVRLRLKDDDTFEGVVGGGIPAGEIITIARGLTIGGDLMSLVQRLVSSLVDLDPDADGNCRSISAALGFEARPAFVNP